MNKKEIIGILLAIILISVTLRLMWLGTTIERDEGVFGNTARELMDGKVLYREIYDSKPPLLYFFYIASILMFGNSILPLRIINILLFAASVCLTYLVARKMAGEKAGLIAAALFGFMMNIPVFEGPYAMSESFGLPFMLLGLYLVAGMRERGLHSRRDIIFASLSFAIGLFINQYYIFWYPFIAYLAYRNSRKRKTALLCLFGFPFLFFLAAYAILSAYGAGDFYLTIYFPFMGKIFPGTKDLFTRLQSVPDYGRFVYPVETVCLILLEASFLFPLILAGIFFAIRGRKADLLLFFALSVFAAAIPPGFGHYYIRAIPAISVLVGYGLWMLFSSKSAILKIAVPLLSACLLIANVYIQSRHYPDYNYSYRGLTWRYSDFDSLAEQEAVSGYIRNNTGDGDTIISWGFNEEIYWLSGRPAPDIHVWSFDCRYYAGRPDRIGKVQDLLMDNRTRPRFIVFKRNYDCTGSGNASVLGGLIAGAERIRIYNTSIYRIY